MQVMAVSTAIHSNVPPSILQALSQISLEETKVLSKIDQEPTSGTRAVRELDSTTVATIGDSSKIRNAFLAALKVDDLLQSQSLFDVIR